MEIETLEQKVSYIYGREIAKELAQKSFPKMNIKIIQEAIMESFMQKPWPFDPSEAEALKKEMEEQRKRAQAEHVEQKQQFEATFFERNAAREQVTIHSSGIQIEIIDEGGERQESDPSSQFLIRHKTWLLNGQQVDGSAHLPEPMSVMLHQAPVAWIVALKEMPVGATWRLYVPAHLAYQEDAHPTVPAETAVIFDIKLESIKAQ
ncbi:FKBP-type peptidyl-prolyl cis-trans isomerase [Vibrio wakamikoensis]|uniref:FKBP-type peptidyl-prolyl cis-trans isomerase N-terminal domain-containing protein n=1 Tax=Vibrio wakamikoensis TaxID=2910251 RepID=UPI003D24FF1F